MSATNTISIRLEVTGDSATLSKITNVLKGVQGLKGGVDQARASMQQPWATGALTGLGSAIGQTQTQVTTLKTRLTEMGSTLASNASAFGVATASVWGVYNAYDSLVKVEIRAESAMNRVSTMTTTLRTLEERLTEARNKGNLSAEEMAILEDRITDTKAKLATAQERSADLQGDVNEAWAAFASQVGPQVVAAAGSIAQLVTNMRGSFTGIIPKIKDFISNLSLSGGSARTLAAGVGPLATTLPAVGTGAHTAATGVRALSGAVKGLLIGTGIGAAFVAVGILTDAFGLLSQSSAKSNEQISGDLAGTSGEVGKYSEGFQAAYDKASKAIEEHAANVKKQHDAMTQTIREATLTEATLELEKDRQAFLRAKRESDAVTAKILSLRKDMESAGQFSNVYATVIKELTAEETRLIAITETKRLGYQKEGLALGQMTDTYNAQNEAVKTSISMGSQAAASSTEHALAIEKTHAAVRRSVDVFVKELTPAVKAGQVSEEAFAVAFATSSASYADFSDLKSVANEHFQKTLETLFPDLEDQEKIKKKLAEIDGTLISTTDELALAYAQFKQESDAKMSALKNEINIKKQQVDSENELIKSVFSNIDVTNLSIEQAESLTGLVTKLTTAYEAEELSLLELAHTYGVNTAEIEKMIFNGEDNLKQIKEIITTNLDYARALTDTAVKTDLVAEGHFNATIAVADFLAEMVKSQAAAERTGLLLKEVLAETFHETLPAGITFTNEMLEEFISVQGDVGKEAAFMSETMNAAFAASKSALQELIDAATKGGKDWKDAWKELDKEFVSGKTKDDLKEFIKDQGELGETVEKVIPVIDAYRQIWDDLSKKERASQTKEFAEALEKVRDQLDDLTSLDIDSTIIDPLLKLKEGGLTSAELGVWEGFFELLNKLKAEGGGIDDNDVKQLQAYVDNHTGMSDLSTSTGDAADEFARLSPEQQKVATNNQLARTIVQITTNLNMQGRAVRGLTSDFNQLVLIMQKMQSLKSGGGDGNGLTRVSADGEEPIHIPRRPEILEEERRREHPEEFLGSMDTEAMIQGHTDLQVALQKTQTALANLATQGANSLNILAEASSAAMSGIQANLSVGEVAAQHIQTGLANLSNQGIKSLAALASGSSKAAQGIRNNLNVGYVAAGHLQTGLANLANQGARSLTALANSSSKNMNGFVNNLKKGEQAVRSLQSAINSLKNKTVHVGLSGPGAKFLKAQHGIHTVVNEPTLLMVGEAGPEKVDVSPVTGAKSPTPPFDNVKNIRLEPFGKLDTGPRFERETIHEQRGPRTIQLVTFTYLYPGSNEYRKSIQQVSLDGTGMFPSA